jgi:hypothetical protein
MNAIARENGLKRRATSKPVTLLLAALCIAAAAFALKNNNLQSINWTFPYFSGAANLDGSFEWRISPEDYDKIAKMSVDEHRAHRYAATRETIPNSVNEYGYVLVAWTARHLFPWLGDIQATVLLQVLAHIIFSLFVLGYLLSTRFQKAAFFALYAVNPLVLYIVTFPLYYFWTVLPALCLGIIALKREKVARWIPAVTAVLLFSHSIRPTGLFLSLFVFLLAGWLNKSVRSRLAVAFCFLAFAGGVFLIQQQGAQRSAFHTLYVGVGAYPNPYRVYSLDDEEGYSYYHGKTGTRISTHAIHGNWNDPRIRGDYNEVLKERYVQILKAGPMLLARNAALNTVQAFGVGYDASHGWTRPLTVGAGAFVVALLIFTGQWIWALGILLYAAGFTLYYPPIPAYLFGAYFLIALGVAKGAEKLFGRLRAARFRAVPERTS